MRGGGGNTNEPLRRDYRWGREGKTRTGVDERVGYGEANWTGAFILLPLNTHLHSNADRRSPSFRLLNSAGTGTP